MSDNAQRVQLGPFFSGGVLQGGARLYHFDPGQTTKKDIWEDRGKVTTLQQPIIADQAGIFNFFADGLYKIVVCAPESTGPDSLVLYTLDNWAFLDPTDQILAEGDAVTAASTVPIGPEIWQHILGSTTINAFAGVLPFFWAVFDGSPMLVNSSNLLLPGSRNRQMLPGDVAFFLLEGNSIYRLASHMEHEGNYMGRQGANVASAGTITPPADGDFIQVTGNDADITAIAAAAAGLKFTMMFLGTGNQFLHNAVSLLCPYGRDYRTVQNEVVTLRSLGSGKWVLENRNGPASSPGTYIPLLSTAADDGCLLPVGTATNCTRYAALAKRCIPLSSTLGVTGCGVGTTTFVAATDIWTLTAHGLSAGDIVHLSNAGGGVPAGYAIQTVYYVVNPTTNTYQLSLTRGGAVVDGTTNGTGTTTLNNKFQLPDVRGLALAALDNLGGSNGNVVTSASVNGANASVLGGRFGAQTHTLQTSETPSHQHVEQVTNSSGTSPTGASTSSGGGSDSCGVGTATTTGTLSGGSAIQTQNAGGGGAHSNTQPSMAVGVQIRW